MSAPPPDFLTLLAMAVAVGLSPYAALSSSGLLAFLGFAELPPLLQGLSWPTVWLTLAALTLLEASAARYRLADLGWNALHVLVQPLAAALFVSAALAPGVAAALVWGTALAASLAALAVHLSVLGVRTALWTAGPKPRLPGFTTVRLTAAIALTLLVSRAPAFAAPAALLILLAPVPSWPRLWGAARTLLAAFVELVRRPGRPRAWTVGPASLPAGLLRVLESRPGRRPAAARSTPVTLARLGPAWRYSPGRLICEPDQPALFAYRRGFTWQTVALSAGPGHGDGHPLLETLEIDGSPPYDLVLGPGAAASAAVLAELAESRRVGSGVDGTPGGPGGVENI